MLLPYRSVHNCSHPEHMERECSREPNPSPDRMIQLLRGKTNRWYWGGKFPNPGPRCNWRSRGVGEARLDGERSVDCVPADQVVKSARRVASPRFAFTDRQVPVAR